MIILKGNAYSFSDLFPNITVLERIGIRRLEFNDILNRKVLYSQIKITLSWEFLRMQHY